MTALVTSKYGANINSDMLLQEAINYVAGYPLRVYKDGPFYATDLASDVAAGAGSITVRDASGFSNGDIITIEHKDGSSSERVTIDAAVTSNTISIGGSEPLAAYPAGSEVRVRKTYIPTDQFWIIGELPAGQQEAAWGAIQSFKNADDILRLLAEGVSTGPGTALVGGGVSVFGKQIIPGKQALGWSSAGYDKLQAAMTSFAASYIKGISGVAVSAQEYERLMKALPSMSKQEGVNRNVVTQLLDTIKNKYELQLGIDFDMFPTQIPQLHLTGGGGEAGTIQTSGGQFLATAPDGVTYTFPNQEAANAFLREVGSM